MASSPGLTRTRIKDLKKGNEIIQENEISEFNNDLEIIHTPADCLCCTYLYNKIIAKINSLIN